MKKWMSLLSLAFLATINVSMADDETLPPELMPNAEVRNFIIHNYFNKIRPEILRKQVELKQKIAQRELQLKEQNLETWKDTEYGDMLREVYKLDGLLRDETKRSLMFIQKRDEQFLDELQTVIEQEEMFRAAPFYNAIAKIQTEKAETFLLEKAHRELIPRGGGVDYGLIAPITALKNFYNSPVTIDFFASLVGHKYGGGMSGMLDGDVVKPTLRLAPPEMSISALIKYAPQKILTEDGKLQTSNWGSDAVMDFTKLFSDILGKMESLPRQELLAKHGGELKNLAATFYNLYLQKKADLKERIKKSAGLEDHEKRHLQYQLEKTEGDLKEIHEFRLSLASKEEQEQINDESRRSESLEQNEGEEPKTSGTQKQ